MALCNSIILFFFITFINGVLNNTASNHEPLRFSLVPSVGTLNNGGQRRAFSVLFMRRSMGIRRMIV